MILEDICDPEIPVLSIVDLGILRNVIIHIPLKKVEVAITPTYSGCPAVDAIAASIRMALMEKGYEQVVVSKILSPAWTTDWMSESAKQKLQSYGIAPPGALTTPKALFEPPASVQCPLCNSDNTVLLSEFGSTACKSLYRCNDCKEPFDAFKCH